MERRPEERPVAVVIMAKVAAAGRTKTRLCPPLTPDEAASLYRAMLADRCEQVGRLRAVVPALAFAPAGGTDGPGGPGQGVAPPELVPAGFRVVPQPEGDLGAGLEAAAAAFLDEGIPVLLVDSDSPTLPQAWLEEAVERLRRAPTREPDRELVLGPSEDGGYHLIGLTRLEPSLFRGVPWSTSSVTATTLERARAAGLRVHSLPPWWDVDDAADLERLERGLFRAWWPAHTADWLRRNRRAPLAPVGDVAPRGSGLAEPGAPDTPVAEVAVDDRWRAPWTRLTSRAVYATPWLSVREDRVRMPDGAPTTYSVIESGHCVGAVPFVDDETVLLVRQYRYVADRVTWEIPTGGVHAGETPEEAMRRELGEEAGVACGRLDYLGAYHTSKSVMDETAHLYVARDLRPAALVSSDETEFIRVERVPFRDTLDMVLSGEITDSMSIIAVLRVALERGLRST